MGGGTINALTKPLGFSFLSSFHLVFQNPTTILASFPPSYTAPLSTPSIRLTVGGSSSEWVCLVWDLTGGSRLWGVVRFGGGSVRCGWRRAVLWDGELHIVTVGVFSSNHVTLNVLVFILLRGGAAMV